MSDKIDDGDLMVVIARAERAERRRIIDDLLAVYDSRVATRRGKRPNSSDDFLAAIIQRIAGIDPAQAAMAARAKGGAQ